MCGGPVIHRADDTEDTVRNRISVYEEQTAPLIAYYEQKGLLFTVDGTEPVHVVQEKIFSALDKDAD